MDYTIGHYPHHARRAILDAVEDALASFGKPVPGSGDVTVIVRCTAPEIVSTPITAVGWTPDKPLFAGATNGQIGLRLIHANGGEPVPLEMIGVVSEYMYACLDDACKKFNEIQQANAKPTIQFDVPPDRARGCATKVIP